MQRKKQSLPSRSSRRAGEDGPRTVSVQRAAAQVPAADAVRDDTPAPKPAPAPQRYYRSVKKRARFAAPSDDSSDEPLKREAPLASRRKRHVEEESSDESESDDDSADDKCTSQDSDESSDETPRGRRVKAPAKAPPGRQAGLQKSLLTAEEREAILRDERALIHNKRRAKKKAGISKLSSSAETLQKKSAKSDEKHNMPEEGEKAKKPKIYPDQEPDKESDQDDKQGAKHEQDLDLEPAQKPDVKLVPAPDVEPGKDQEQKPDDKLEVVTEQDEDIKPKSPLKDMNLKRELDVELAQDSNKEEVQMPDSETVQVQIKESTQEPNQEQEVPAKQVELEVEPLSEAKSEPNKEPEEAGVAQQPELELVTSNPNVEIEQGQNLNPVQTKDEENQEAALLQDPEEENEPAQRKEPAPEMSPVYEDDANVLMDLEGDLKLVEPMDSNMDEEVNPVLAAKRDLQKDSDSDSKESPDCPQKSE